MSQLTDRQLEAASERAAAKLRAFYDGLADDERLALSLATRQFVAGADADTQGHMINLRDQNPRPVGPEQSGLIPYTIMSPILYTLITPTYRTSV